MPMYLASIDPDLIELIIKLGVFLGLMTVGYVVGTLTERNHYKDIKKREKLLLQLPAFPMTLDTVLSENTEKQVSKAHMVIGSVVLSEDYFKAFLASLKTFFGGNLTSHESLLDRARREAVLRMKEKAVGADMIVNLRLESASIGKEGGAESKGPTSIEMIAYGTAITFQS